MINRCDLCYKRNVETTRVLILSDVFNVCEECYDNEIKLYE